MPLLLALGRAWSSWAEAQDGIESRSRGLDFRPMIWVPWKNACSPSATGASMACWWMIGISPKTPARGWRRLTAVLPALPSWWRCGRGGIGYQREAMALTKARKAAATRLDRAMAAELAPLKMERAVFSTEISAGDPGLDGMDAVQFTVATNPAPAGALNKIARGELSRFLLALKVCSTANTPGSTMIFDEIDRGVGGATADAVGRCLKALSMVLAGDARGWNWSDGASGCDEELSARVECGDD